MLVRRTNKTGGNDIQVVYRPCRIDEFFGNETNKKLIKGALESDGVPHSYLFTGDPGCGKTTMARIISMGINCEEDMRPLEEQTGDDVCEHDHYVDDPRRGRVLTFTTAPKRQTPTPSPCLKCRQCLSVLNHNSLDSQEINVGAYGNKGDIVKVIEDLPTAPFMARRKVLILDEAHKLSSAAQDALLKVVEDSYSHVYFIFCTNEIEKLKGALIDRCNVMHFGRLPFDAIKQLLIEVCDGEGIDRTNKTEVLDYIAQECQGVPRRAIVWLKQINDSNAWSLEEAKEITGVMVDENTAEVIELCRALNKGEWKDAVRLYGKLKKVPPETVRIAVEGYFTSCLRRAGTYTRGRHYSAILDAINTPIYQTGKTADNRMYNYMFKVVDLMKKGGK